MSGTNRKKSERSISLWMGIVGVPVGIFATIFAWMGLNIALFLPISILIGLLTGLITYTFLLRQDIKDKDDKIKLLNKKIKKDKDGKKKKE